MTIADPNDTPDLEGIARGDYFEPTDKAGVADTAPAGDLDADDAGDTAGAQAGHADADQAASEAADQDANAGADADAKAVPYVRFKDVVTQKNTAQARILELEAQLAAAPAAPAAPAAEAAKVDKVSELIASRQPLYTQVEEARLDGEIALAATLQQQIDDLNAQILLEKSSAVSKQAVAVDREAQQYDALIDSLEAKYPQFRPAEPEYDRALVVDINETADAFEARGLSPTAAMQRALKIFDTRLNPPAAQATPATPAAPAGPAAPKPDIGKSVSTIKGQPADMSTAGANKDDVAINVAVLSDEEYDKLPESTRAKLRGDFAA